MKPYTVSGNLICPDFSKTPEDPMADHMAHCSLHGEPASPDKITADHPNAFVTESGDILLRVEPTLDAYEQLESEHPGELLYMSKPLVEPPCDVERKD